MKVGFFDSGIGGTCILNAFKKLCPDVETVYIADSKNCPYGNKPAEEIIRLSEANVTKLLKTDLAVSLTGIAGPDGGSEEKPVGLVWFGLSTRDGVRTEKCIFRGDRAKVREQAVTHALGMLTIGAT